MELKAIAMVELNSIAKGVQVGDEMLKTSDVELIMAQPICAGKYMVLVSGDVDSVERASEVGKEVAAEFLVDDFVMRKLKLATMLCCTFMIVEVIGGLLAGSLAVLSDAAHLLADLASFAASIASLSCCVRSVTVCSRLSWCRARARFCSWTSAISSSRFLR